MVQFKVGDKVMIVEGGWGIHPSHEGKVVTIASFDGHRYTWVEDLISEGKDGFFQRGGYATADGRSFKLLDEVGTIELIRQVNQRIHQEGVAHEARLTALKAERDVLVAALMEELQ